MEGIWIRCLDTDGNVVAYAEGAVGDKPLEALACTGTVKVEVGPKVLSEFDRALAAAF